MPRQNLQGGHLQGMCGDFEFLRQCFSTFLMPRSFNIVLLDVVTPTKTFLFLHYNCNITRVMNVNS